LTFSAKNLETDYSSEAESSPQIWCFRFQVRHLYETNGQTDGQYYEYGLFQDGRIKVFALSVAGSETV